MSTVDLFHTVASSLSFLVLRYIYIDSRSARAFAWRCDSWAWLQHTPHMRRIVSTSSPIRHLCRRPLVIFAVSTSMNASQRGRDGTQQTKEV